MNLGIKKEIKKNKKLNKFNKKIKCLKIISALP